MKAGLTLLRNARAPQNEAKVPFVPDLPMKLRNHVTGKHSKTKGIIINGDDKNNNYYKYVFLFYFREGMPPGNHNGIIMFRKKQF